MNWYEIFYWLTVADGIKHFMDSASDIFTTATIITGILYIFGVIGYSNSISDRRTKNDIEDKADPDIRSWDKFRKYATITFYPFLFLAIITWCAYVFVPSKKDCLMIIAGGAVGNFITSDSSAKALPSDLTRFLHLSLKKQVDDLSDDAKKELGLQTPKEQFVDKLKNLTKEEIINALKTDSLLIGK